MQPSDSLASFGRDFGSPRQRPTSWDRRFSADYLGDRRMRLQTRQFRRNGSPALRHSGLSRGKTRASRVTGLSSSYAPWCNIPPDTASPRPYFSLRRSTERPPSPSENSDPLASGTNIVFGTTYPRLARSRTYASQVSLPRPAPGSLPARAGSPLAGRVSHPLDRKTKFHGDIAIPPIPIDQQSLVAPNFLFSTTIHEIRKNTR